MNAARRSRHVAVYLKGGAAVNDRHGITNDTLPARWIRGVKEWLSKNFPRGSSYKPTLDQLPLTRMIRFDRLRSCGLPCFGTLERAVHFLANAHERGLVYP